MSDETTPTPPPAPAPKDIKFPVKRPSDFKPEGIEMTPEQQEAFAVAFGVLSEHFPIVLLGCCLGFNPKVPKSVAVMAKGTPHSVLLVGKIAVKQAPHALEFMRKLRESQPGKN